MSKPRVLLVGWDAADWKVIQPLVAAGRMPNLARLLGGGVHGNLATIYPVLSPMLWTSIATGKRAYKHGIHGFTEPLPDGTGVRPISLLSRKTKAVWNILNQTGHRSVVVGWWPSHPAEPLNGVMVSNHFAPPVGEPGTPPPLPAGTVHPASLGESLADLRVNPMELTGEFLRMFVPKYDKVNQAEDKRLHSLARIIAETMSVHAAATEVLARETWDFGAVYYSGIDHFGHAFMRYHPPRLPWVSEEDFALYQHVVVNAYQYHDAMLGALPGFADENTTVILLSDHGFHPDHLRRGYIPAEPAGPAVEHRHYGILCLKGPGILADEKVFGASLLDVCPTILALFGLPAGKDMDGKVLVTALKETRLCALEPIESWDGVAGDAGTHPQDTRLDPVASAQAFQQLVDLGYVAPPAADARQTVAECVRELTYNLARAYRDGNCCGDAAALAEDLWARWPQEHRFGILLVDCLGPIGLVERRRAVIEELGRRLERFQAEAQQELTRREAQAAREPKTEPPAAGGRPTRDQFERRQLHELAQGRPLLMEWLQVSQALIEKRPDEARRHLEQLCKTEGMSDDLSQRVASALGELGDLDGARALLEEALTVDPENALVHAQLAGVHFQAGRYEQSVDSATESLSLLYFQPGLHALLGHALMEVQRFGEAEQALRVAVSQSPRNLAAHELLGQLYRRHFERPADAFAHEGRARSLRHELDARRRAGSSAAVAGAPSEIERAIRPTMEPIAGDTALPPPFATDVDSQQIVTVVSGLPRSGTSMMMQMLTAAGREPLTDGKRRADEDNPLGYFEFEKTLALNRDNSWISLARGRVVKIVAQLLPFLPPGYFYHVVFMERNLEEVVASQQAMLKRQGRSGSELESGRLRDTYAAQLQSVRARLARRPDIRILSVSYAELLADPAAGVGRVGEFLGQPFDRQAAVASVHPELRRQKT